MKEKLYTAGEVANMAGVSLRTIRFYDSKGLLKPVFYSEAGYRYYGYTASLPRRYIRPQGNAADETTACQHHMHPFLLRLLHHECPAERCCVCPLQAP